MPWRQPAPKTNCSCHTFVACLILYLGVLFTYALFADISLFQHVTKLFSKCGISSPFHLAQGFLVSWNPLPIRTFNFMISWGMVKDKVIDVSADWILRVQRFFSPSRLLQQKAMITIANDIVAVDILVRLRFLPIDREWSPLVSHFFIRRTSERATIRAGSKMECVELYFISAAHEFYCQAIKKFEFFGATRATRQQNFETSSTGDENGTVMVVMTSHMQILLSPVSLIHLTNWRQFFVRLSFIDNKLHQNIAQMWISWSPT